MRFFILFINISQTLEWLSWWLSRLSTFINYFTDSWYIMKFLLNFVFILLATASHLSAKTRNYLGRFNSTSRGVLTMSKVVYILAMMTNLVLLVECHDEQKNGTHFTKTSNIATKSGIVYYMASAIKWTLFQHANTSFNNISLSQCVICSCGGLYVQVGRLA